MRNTIKNETKKVNEKVSFVQVWWYFYIFISRTEEIASQPVFTCLKLTIETLEQGVKYVQS